MQRMFLNIVSHCNISQSETCFFLWAGEEAGLCQTLPHAVSLASLVTAGPAPAVATTALCQAMHHQQLQGSAENPSLTPPHLADW